MTTEEATHLKVEAENKVVEILNYLEKQTGCDVTHINFSKVTEELYGMDRAIEVGRFVNITLAIK